MGRRIFCIFAVRELYDYPIMKFNSFDMRYGRILVALTTVIAFLVGCDIQKPDDEHQVEKSPELRVSPLENTISAAGGEVSLVLTANMDWTVTGAPDWLTVSPTSGEGSLYKQTIVVTAAANEGTQREAVLSFAIEDLIKEVKVVQLNKYGSDASSNTIFFESFKKGIGDFTINDVNRPESLAAVWEHSSQYSCMKATAYSNNKNLASESWLVSPEIDLSGLSSAYFTFEHAGMYFGTVSNEATAWISKDGGEWVQLQIADDDYPTNWGFISAGNWDLADYLGSKVKFGFKYSSTATKAGTWEVRNVEIVAGAYGDDALPQIDPTKTSWMELPATDNEGLDYIAHRFEMGGEIYRNYSFGWSRKDLVSVWVAYPLNKTYTNSVVQRNDDAWAYDPVLGKKLSSAPFSYYAGDYARGHQLPSADRLCSDEANKQTFYGSNIAPQLNEHNEGIWVNLENHVRDIANASDTTYVVTGCLVEGATETSTDSDGKTITIPTAFYKALLRYEAGAENEWTCAGFFTEHKNYTDKSLKAIAMSIDELEEKTGFDFFVHLADKIGKEKADALEAQDPKTVAVWKLN